MQEGHPPGAEAWGEEHSQPPTISEGGDGETMAGSQPLPMS